MGGSDSWKTSVSDWPVKTKPDWLVSSWQKTWHELICQKFSQKESNLKIHWTPTQKNQKCVGSKNTWIVQWCAAIWVGYYIILFMVLFIYGRKRNPRPRIFTSATDCALPWWKENRPCLSRCHYKQLVRLWWEQQNPIYSQNLDFYPFVV